MFVDVKVIVYSLHGCIVVVCIFYELGVSYKKKMLLALCHVLNAK